MRRENNHPSTNSMGGFVYITGERPGKLIPFIKPPERVVDWQSILASFDHDRKHLFHYADSLGVEPESLHFLGAAYSYSAGAWAYPMRDGRENIIGIRLRADSGKKWAVPGSHNGLFIPHTLKSPTMLICEGPTDTAAALSLGYFAIGKPSCECGADIIQEFIRLRHIRRVIVIPDNDTPGLRGARKLKLACPTVEWIPPAKDLREFVKRGGTREIMESSLRDLVYEQL